MVSVLPQGYFPWFRTRTAPGNVSLVRNQVAAYKAALDKLAGNPAVDPHRIAVVGHDYGAMYGALLADRDHRVSVLAMQAPDSCDRQPVRDVLAPSSRARREPTTSRCSPGSTPSATWLGWARHVLFQWAGQDEFVPEEVRNAFIAARTPGGAAFTYERAHHQLTDAAIGDLVAFLSAQLGLGG